MQTTHVTPGQIYSCRRLLCAAAALGLLLVFGFAQPASAQNVTTACTPTSLCLDNNYFVTGDYVVGGAILNGPFVNGLATGTVTVPDPLQPNSTGVPAGADIVAAFLYWATVEGNQSLLQGQNGVFNGYPITATVLGNQNAPTSWSPGGCSGNAQGSKTIRGYRADVRPFLPLDANGKIQTPNALTPGIYQVGVADSGKNNGNGAPITLGATLVIIYRVLSPAVPLNSIVLYDGAAAPSNASSTLSQPMVGFYQAGLPTLTSPSPLAKITHIVGNGQTGKSEIVSFNGVTLPPLYAANPTVPFPGIYNGSWDNVTWTGDNSPINTLVHVGDFAETTSVAPTPTNGNCVDWGAIIFSTTVQENDNDGLLAVWKTNQGYIDAKNGQWISLPGATIGQKDLFVEIDYLSNLDRSASNYAHSHLPKRAALDMVGDALKHQNPSVNVHFDLGPGIYQGDPYVIPYPTPPPLQGATVFPGAGGNAISEGLLVCTDSTTFCAFPGSPAIGWKGGFTVVKNTPTSVNGNLPLGNFQPGRKDSYHYVLFGHVLGSPRTYWSAAAQAPNLAGSGLTTLVSIVVSGAVNSGPGTGTITLKTPQLLLKPGDVGCTDSNCNRITVEGALQPQNAALNATYKMVGSPSSVFDINTNTFTTTVSISTVGVASGTYDFFSEPQLGVTYGGPTTASGHSDLGGADTAEMFGGWPGDDAPGCQADPSIPLNSGQTYCVNQVGTITAEAGTLMHEMGHTLTLTHGGQFFPNEAGAIQSGPLAGQYTNVPSVVPSYGLNCNPAFLSSMNYLFQIRGFPDGGIGYSGQTLPDLSESGLSEMLGIGSDRFTGSPASHFTRWYAPPNAVDTKLQNTTGTRFASIHCDGSPIGPNEPPAVRVDGSSFSTFIDWNNDLIVPDAVGWQDVNFNGSTSLSPDPAFPGFNDLLNLDLRQIGARLNVFGFSGGGITGAIGGGITGAIGGGITGAIGGGITGAIGGGSPADPGSGITGAIGGGITGAIGGGITGAIGGGESEQDAETACSTADPPTSLLAAPSPLTTHNVLLTWTSPGQCQVRRYDVWRATGSFPTLLSVLQNIQQFTDITPNGITGTPPLTTFTDTNVKNKTTYTYFVTDTSQVPNTTKQATSGPSNPPATIFVVF
jgi:hypothetical protein